jgi:hypothetical protein
VTVNAFKLAWKQTVFACAVLSSAFANLQANAQTNDTIRSAKLAPVDADFYYGTYQLKEQWNRLVAGPVVQEAIRLAVVDRLWNQFQSDWQDRKGVLAQVRFGLENGNVKSVLAFLEELSKKEIFVLGDKRCSEILELSGLINDDMATLVQASQDESPEAAKTLLSKWIDTLSSKSVPVIMMGARCDNQDMALEKIDILEAPIRLAMTPELAPYFKEFKRIDDARGDRLQIVFRGSLIPWDRVPENNILDESIKSKLQGVLNNKSITVTIGLFDGNFVFALSSTPEELLALGKGPSILEHPDMQLVRDSASKPLTSIGYVSDALSKANFNASYKNFFSRQLTRNRAQLKRLLEDKPAWNTFVEKLADDFQWADQTIGKYIPEFKGSTSVAFMTSDGWERVDQFRTKDILSDGSGQLKMLEHVGANPLMLAVSKLQDRPEYFQVMRSLVQRAKMRADEALELDWSDFGADFDNEEVKKNLKLVWPFVVRLADVWEKKFLPGMSGEHGIVLSGGNLAAKQWFKEMPMSAEPLPLPELASITGVRNQELIKSGFEELFAICDDVVKLVRQMDPNAIPAGYEVPRPTRVDSTLGDKYGYPIPKDCPVPPEMMPQAVFSGSYLIETYSDKQSASLSAITPLNVGKDVIDPKAKQSAASYIHVGRLFEYVRPWFRYGLSEAMDSLDDYVFEEVIEEEYEDYDVTGKELLSTWSVLTRIGDFSSSTTPTDKGGIQVRSVYRSQKTK